MEVANLYYRLQKLYLKALPAVQELPDLAEFDTRAMLAMEKEMTGVYITGHPMALASLPVFEHAVMTEAAAAEVAQASEAMNARRVKGRDMRLLLAFHQVNRRKVQLDEPRFHTHANRIAQIVERKRQMSRFKCKGEKHGIERLLVSQLG